LPSETALSDGPDAGPHCSIYTDDHASIRVYPGDGTVWLCNPPGLVDAGGDAAPTDVGADVREEDGGTGPNPAAIHVLRGTITGGDATSLVLDTCAGAPGCTPNSTRVELNAPGLDLTTVPRVQVELRFQIKFFYTCQESLEIRALDSVDGSSAAAGHLLVAVADGAGPFADSPYDAVKVPLGCSSAKGCGSQMPDVYAFDFRMASDSSSTLRVYMGETATWKVSGHSYAVRNLRSFQGSACDDYWNFAYYVVSSL
jgi:hypothetical protein